MLRPSAAGKQKVSRPVGGDPDSASVELKFIADLGRSLLFTVHPKKVASKVADAIRFGSGCDVCAFVVELNNIGLVSSAYDKNGELQNEFLNRERFDRWLDFLPPQIGYTVGNDSDFL